MTKNKYHVTYLGQSALDKVNKACQERSNKSEKEMLHLKWLQLSLSLNRQVQMKYISENLDARAGNNKLKGIQMKPFLAKWKKQEYRKMWKNLTNKLRRRENKQKLGISSENSKELQDNAVKFFTDSLFGKAPQITEVFTDERVKDLKEIQQETSVTKARDLSLTESSAPPAKKSNAVIYTALVAIIIVLIVAFVLFWK
ncbi:hypothetical protein TVAG_286310 [Trichomonas vaginalis G3]|uniref:Uncharacterized protein n=1 Tax=Trichomonas vaginalis (strain ATCC PRA-98 / G3) TaxID=412133 RepID=A2EPE5_TRIV3|nr:hypothetical protein TVAGG3_0616270 [Trichomonas vaginalis G3]EAY05453.1 hypothetical protein TVAG_286310 [Trichomonas vaginalis G3]KAI5503569.1 hypothetical protein TVAGG3_0616270 [Trichomonas vaginalis G3]|eukprot:XP_001317676.1 hypothetical protein [Trichomonas vaginalis G3]